MKILRYLAFALGGLVALLVAAGLFVYATFDAAKLKSELTQIVREKKQRELAIDGELALSFWPSIGVRLGHVRLSEHASDKRFAALESARVSLALIPLFSKQVVIDRLELAGVDATLVRGKDGKLNIDDLLAREEQPESQAVRFDIAAVDIERARLAWRDEKTGQTATLSELDLATGKIANQARGRLELTGKLAAEQPAAKADIALRADYDIDLDRKRYALASTELKLKGEAASLSGLDVGLAAGRLGFEAGGAVQAEKLRLAARAMLADEQLEIRLDTPRLQADADQASGEAVNLAARLVGPQRNIDAKLDFGGMQGTAAALKVDRLALAVDAKLGETSTKAAIASPLEANLQAMTFDLAKIAGELSLASARLPLKSLRLPLDGELHADLGKQTASARLATRLDESAMHAKFSVAKFAPLALGFDIDVDRINVDKYLPPAASSASDARKDKEAADTPIDLSALKGLDATGAVRIGALQMSGIKATNIKLEIKAANGKLEVAPHSANLYEGTLAGALSVDANGNRVTAKETLVNVNIDPLLRDVAHKDLLEGRGSVTLDVATGGASVKAMKRALGGSARIALRDGAVKGINIAKTLREYKAVAGMQQGVTQKAVTTEKTDFTEMSASFRIANGIAHNDDLMAKSPLLRLTGSGDIDIAENRIDYLVKASVVATSTGQEGKELAKLKGVTLPVRLNGPFDALAWQLDYGAVATELAKAKVGEATQQLQQRAQEKVQEKMREGLKGLFGR